MKSVIWNPWHGCKKYSEGCLNCYVYRRDFSIGKDASVVYRTGSFYDPVARKRDGEYRIPSGTHLFCCMTSDFFLDEADSWRNEAWQIMKQRSDCRFTIITKRIDRFLNCLPEDWNDGWDNITICCTMENQNQVDKRLKLFLSLPIKHKEIICEPLLSDIDFHNLLNSQIEMVTVGGESGDKARLCDYDWVLHIRNQCITKDIPFYFKQTGAVFKKGAIVYHIARKFQMAQARKADISTTK